MVLDSILRGIQVVWVVGEEDVRSVVVVVVWSVCDVGRLSVDLEGVDLRGSGLVPLGVCVIRWTVGLVLIWYVGIQFLQTRGKGIC